MTETLLYIIAACAALTVLASLFLVIRALTGKKDAGAGEQLTALRSESAAAMRDLRQEVSSTLFQFQNTLQNALQDKNKSQSDLLQQLGSHQKERLEEVTREVTTLGKNITESQNAVRQTLETRLDVMRNESMTKLEDMRKTVDEKLQSTLEKRLTESFQQVREQLDRVHQGLGEMQSLASGVGDLKKVLSNVKTRGIWGEMQLANILEQFLTPDQYLVNAQVKANSAERVEFAVRLPGRSSDGEVLLPIDAKFPQEDYERLVAAAEEGARDAVEAAVAQLEVRVRQFAKTICDKYINPPATTDFAILFLPTESLYAEMLRRPGFFERLQREYRVTLAGPTTLTALLNALQMGFRSLAIEQRSSEVWKVLGAVRAEFDKYDAVVGKLQDQLNTALGTIDKLGTRTRVMGKTLKNVEILPENESKMLLGFDQPLDLQGDVMDEENATPMVANIKK